MSATLAIALALCCAVAPVWAQGQGNGRERNEPPQAREHRDRRRDEGTLSDSVRRVERDTRGQILSAERVPFDGREMHRVKVLDDRGRVRVYMDDPRQRRGGTEPPQRPTRGDDD